MRHSAYLKRPNPQHLLLFRRLPCSYASRPVSRNFSIASTPNVEQDSVRRSYLYVPASSERMLEKSLTTNSDIIIYDLEDSVSPNEKDNARLRLQKFLDRGDIPDPERVAVRVNDLRTPFFQRDISEILKSTAVRTLVLPKVHSADDLHQISEKISFSSVSPLRLVTSIESAKAMWNLGAIAGWKSSHSPEQGGVLSALLFAAEDYCADTSIIRTESRQELLYTRSRIVIAAKAFGLDAIDMVCVNYKNLDYLKEECQDGRRLGFNGKQAIHPTQVDVIQSTFVPTSQEILRAAKIVHQMEVSYSSRKGAFGLEMDGGGKEMIDAPMLKQAEKTLRIAAAAGLTIPDVSS